MTETVSRSLSTNAFAPPNVKFGRCLHKSAEDVGMSHQEYMWVSSAKVTPKEMKDAMSLWGLQPPNLVLNLSGPANAHLVCREMLEHPSLQPMVKDRLKAERSLRGLSAAIASTGSPQPANEESLGVAKIEDAEKQSFVEKVSSEISDGLEAERSLRGPNTPIASKDAPQPTDETSLGLASLEEAEGERFVKMMHSELSDRLVKAFVALLQACEQTNSWIVMCYDAPGLTDYFLYEALLKCPHRPVILAMVDRTYELWNDKVDIWAALEQNTLQLIKGQRKEMKKLPITDVNVEVPYPLVQHGKLFNGWVAAFATHFIYSEAKMPHPLVALGPRGNLFLSGGGGVSQEIETSMERMLPTIILLHTGRACDFYGCAVEVMKEDKPKTVTELVEKMTSRHPFWYQSAEDGQEYLFNVLSKKHVVERASAVFARYNANAEHFHDSVVVLNAWTADPFTIVNKVSACFASVSGGVSLNKADADLKSETIMMAWSLHDTLASNSGVFAKRILLLQSTTVLLALLTTTFAVLLTYVKEESSTGWAKNLMQSSYFGCASVFMVVLPAIGGISAQILSRFQYGSMWGSLRVTKQEIESEILRFRSSTGDYRPLERFNRVSDADEDDDDDDDTNKKVEREEPRSVLSKKVSDLFTVLSCHGLQDTSLEPSEGTCLIQKDLAVKGKRPASDLAKRDIEQGYATFQGCSEALAKDMYSTLDGEEYFRMRFLSTLEEFQTEAPPLAAKLRAYEILILFCALLSTLLAALKLTLWIPIPMAVGACLASFLQFEALKARIAALNIAIGELTAFATKWSSLAVYEKRTNSVKEEMVNLVESAWKRHIAAYVSGSGYMGNEKKNKAKQSDDTDDKTAAKGKKGKSAA